jgi:hypothetical protein
MTIKARILRVVFALVEELDQELHSLRVVLG